VLHRIVPNFYHSFYTSSPPDSMFPFAPRFSLRILILLVLPFIAIPLRAQTPADTAWAKWWFGGGGGVNINLFSGAVHDLGTPSDTSLGAPNGFTEGSGLGLNIHLLAEYNSGGLLGGALTLGYDSRKVKFDQVVRGTPDTTENATVNMAYLSIEPSLRINPLDRRLHLLLGPTFGINVGKGYEYERVAVEGTSTVTTAHTGDVVNARSFVLGANVGVGYDIPVWSPPHRPQFLVTPFVEGHFGQGLLDVASGNRNDFGVNTLRLGVRVKFGSPAAPPAELVGNDSSGPVPFTLDVPPVVTESRALNETFPVRNYIFFDAGSTALPTRYTQLTPEDAGAFREEQLLRDNAEPGGSDPLKVRSRRQMGVYYDALNIFGDRMRRTPGAKATLIGSANGDAAAGKQMAENVKSYLTSRFGIEPARLTTEGRPQPRARSGSGAATGEDRKMVDAENYRVEIDGTPAELLQPVSITSTQEAPTDNDIVVRITPVEGLENWTVEMNERPATAGRSPRSQTFGPYPASQTVARIDARPLLEGGNSARWDARLVSTMSGGKRLVSPPQEFRIVRADEGDEQPGTRFSILFEFDQSKTIETYRSFLENVVAPAVPNGSSVFIRGYTDLTGDVDYNQKLAQKRCDETQAVIQAALTKMGRTATFDTYGFGEDEQRSPFNNTLPEQRFYNRTVVIDVLPGR